MATGPRIIVTVELATQGLSVSAIAHQFDRRQETVRLWLKAIRIEGPPAILERYTEAPKGPRRRRGRSQGPSSAWSRAFAPASVTAADRRFNTFWPENSTLISPFPRSMRSWPNGTSYSLGAHQSDARPRAEFHGPPRRRSDGYGGLRCCPCHHWTGYLYEGSGRRAAIRRLCLETPQNLLAQTPAISPVSHPQTKSALSLYRKEEG